jgi:cell division protein FtsA
VKAHNTNFTAVDIGSSKISILAADLNISGDARIGYQSVFQSMGIKSGVIIDSDKAENSIINGIYNLEKSLDKNITSVNIAISGAGTKSLYVYQKIRLPNPKVSKEDIKNLLALALKKFDDSENTVIHYFPIEYTLDQNSSINNPLGMFGNSLGVRLHVIVANTSQVSNIINCFSKCHIKVKHIIAAPFAASLAVLTEDEKSLGSMVIDIGATTTSYAIFSGGNILYAGYIPVGSQHITSDISQVLSVSIPCAEKLKVMYGSATISDGDSVNLINIADIEKSDGYDFENNISSSDLKKIISARCEEMIEMIKGEYTRIGLDHLIGRRIVLTGGGAQLRGIKELVSSNFNKQVRIGYPQNIPGFDIDHSTYSYHTSIGIVKNEMSNIRKFASFSDSSANILEKMSSWFKSSI